MGACVHCGKPAGLLARRHPHCRPRLIDDRRWCSERRLEERRESEVGVWAERRRAQRRQAGDRRSGLDRRQTRARAWA